MKKIENITIKILFTTPNLFSPFERSIYSRLLFKRFRGRRQTAF